MDAEIETIRKVDALTRSPNKGEASAARSRLQALLKKRGKTVDDLASILNPQPVGGSGFQVADGTGRTVDLNNPVAWGEWFAVKDDPIARDKWFNAHAQAPNAAQTVVDGFNSVFRRMAEEQLREAEPKREAIIAHYGSVKAALALNEQELLLRKAVARWCEFNRPPDDRWVGCVDGYSAEDSEGEPPKRVAQAIAVAYPLPHTIAEAHAEFLFWDRRRVEIRTVLRRQGYGFLDGPAGIRFRMVEKMLREGMRAKNLEDVIARQRYVVDGEPEFQDEINAAVLADLEHLAALEKNSAQPAPFGKTRPAKQPRKVNVAQSDFGF